MGSALGALKVAAARTGLSLDDYQARISKGEKWCTGCKAWHPRGEFATDRSRGDGLAGKCRTYANSRSREGYEPKERPVPGRRFVDARTGDQRQARRRVNYLVEAGLIPRPNSLPCGDCGHEWRSGERRHEYDHFKGYAPEHHESVEVVCTTCHHAREDERRAA